MAKKSKDVEKPKIPFERCGESSGLSMGIVGLPNVGKSTLFNRLTGGSVLAENYPFCTIDPSVGHVTIKDPRVDFLKSVYKPAKTIYAQLKIIDIAGLVKDAAEGKGLGNQFLDRIRAVDGIFLVTRCFEDSEIIHVEGGVDPLRDIEIIRDELRKKDQCFIAGELERATVAQRSKPGDKKAEKAVATIKRLVEITKTKWVNEECYDADEIAQISRMNLLTTKNVVILANTSADDYASGKKNAHLSAVMEKYGDNVIPFSCVHTATDLSEPLPEEFVNRLVAKGYESLGLINFFTVGKDEVRSWTIRKGIKAPGTGGAIHSDFEKYFISAEVMEYDAFVKHPSETAMRSAGLYQQKGKEYVVKDGDMILFKFNAPNSKRK